MVFIRVVLPVPLQRCFDYLAPATCLPGMRVRVPFGRRELIGVVLENNVTPDCTPDQIKTVSAVLDSAALLPASILDLCRFASEYYCQPLGEFVLQSLPTWLRDGGDSEGLLETAWQQRAGVSCSGSSAVARQLWQALQQPIRPSQLRALSPRASHWFKRWQTEELLQTVVPVPAAWTSSAHQTLNEEQQSAVDAIRAALGQFHSLLLAGITGSGKTEVYLQAMETALRAGRQVLVLVPEINLTPQLQARFAARFPGLPLVCLHSQLADKERAINWQSAASGEARLILGTRLALFTPLPDLGLIIADEEHDGSFRQQEGLRFSARDLAVWRAHQTGVPIVLGSATPALETWHKALAGRYGLQRLTRRAVQGAALPKLRLIDVRRNAGQDGISPELRDAIAARLQRGEQSLIFVNRRGYAPVLFCDGCGWMSACRRCSVRLVVHLSERRLRCHHCGWEERIPTACPSCMNKEVRALGQGTQRIEDALGQLFPDARIVRIDRDSTRRKGSFAALMEDAAAGRIDILVGTQMLSKGHDLPRMTLVGILNADAALFAPDYRAPERLFAQLLQVSGRAGRHQLAGEVMLQTRFPEHPLYHAWLLQQWETYAAQLLQERREAGFPPYQVQALLRAEAPDRDRLQAFLQHAARLLPVPKGVEIYDPVDALPAKVANRHRMQLLLQSQSRPLLHRFLAQWWAAVEDAAPSGIRWTVDVDPTEL